VQTGGREAWKLGGAAAALRVESYKDLWGAIADIQFYVVEAQATT
jgi:hypothetical protein